ncbi:MAG: HDOD domain-containing protein [Chitinivibrionales bacterium]|nr:HDOD domain-containing protein [Chitinivibrionales bacterium]
MADHGALSDSIIGIIDRLPPMPETIRHLRRMAANPNITFKALLPVLKKDPAICADLLHMANSAYYGINHPVETLDEAVRYFGVQQLINYISISFSDKAIREFFTNISNLSDYFTHSRRISVASTELAKAANLGKHEQDVVAIAGLLHDLGRLIIIMASNKRIFKTTNAQSQQEIEAIVNDEKEVLGIDHCIIGKKICAKWKFTELLQTAVEKHHTPLNGGVCKQAAFILLGHFISMKTLSDELLLSVFDESILDQLGLNGDMLIAAHRSFDEVWAEVSG